MQDSRGNTPLHTVYEGVELSGSVIPHVGGDAGGGGGGRRLDITGTLLDIGADVNVRNNRGDTPLMLTVKGEYAAFVPLPHIRLLLRHGADPNTRDNAGTTALIVPVSSSYDYYESVEIIVELIGAGADPDLRDSQGDTPLIHAARHEDDIVAVTEALLAGGADPCLDDASGKLPYDHAKDNSNTGVQNLLYKVGGYFDKELGICARDAAEAIAREQALNLSQADRRRIQSCLKTQGFDPGTPDGLFGSRTRHSIRAWQSAQGKEGDQSTGYLAQGDAQALLAACTVAVEPDCANPDRAEGGCWMEIANQPGCYTWNPNPQPEETVTWSGGCVDNKASGKGKRAWRFRKDGQWKTSSGEGEIRNDKMQGHWVSQLSDGSIWEGSYTDDKRHGYWVERGSRGMNWSCGRNGERVDKDFCLNAVDGRKMEVKVAVKLRSGPSGDYEEIDRLQAGATVSVTGESGSWLWVEAADETAGFVQGAMLAEPSFVAGHVFRDCANCPQMVVIPSGSFVMGSPSSEEHRHDHEGPQHEVTISDPFAVGKYEVTFSEWDACVSSGGCGGYRPDDEGWGRGNRPVIHVSWGDAQTYVTWLSRETGHEYRLLSESEWEYVARAGTETEFHTGRRITTDQANFNGDLTYNGSSKGVYREKTVSVGSFPGNDFGLHDVHGNVREWVEDCRNANYDGAPTDGGAWTAGECEYRVLRGGTWYSPPGNLRSAGRNRNSVGSRHGHGLGFRVARTLTP